MKSRVRFIPIFIVVAGVGLAFRIGSITTDIGDLVGVANAQQEQEPAAEQSAGAEGAPAADADDADDGDNGAGDEISSAITDPLLMTRSELDLLQDLAERRQQLDGRDRQQGMREMLLEATEARIDGKIVRLENIRTEIEALLAEHQVLENAQLQSLVKVYESMKPKDAARILEKLEIDIQMDVATRMKEVKMAKIMAAMAADAARRLTVEMAIRAQLPVIEG